MDTHSVCTCCFCLADTCPDMRVLEPILDVSLHLITEVFYKSIQIDWDTRILQTGLKNANSFFLVLQWLPLVLLPSPYIPPLLSICEPTNAMAFRGVRFPATLFRFLICFWGFEFVATLHFYWYSRADYWIGFCSCKINMWVLFFLCVFYPKFKPLVNQVENLILHCILFNVSEVKRRLEGDRNFLYWNYC